MDKIFESVARFQSEVFPQHRELFEDLADAQAPRALLITCADSRVVPSLITQTKPGEIFICRNAGNIVPPFGDAMGGVSATLEYAVSALNVRHVIVCGHTDCGAMWGILRPHEVAHMKAVAHWLHYGEAARAVVERNYGHLTGRDLLLAVTEQNVVAQLANLQTHPCVAAGLASNSLQLHGWIYHIESGEVRAWDPGQRRFVSLSRRSAQASRAPE